MDDFFKMDIFFVIATGAVLVLLVGGGFIFWRVQRILKNVDHISEQVAIGSDVARQDLRELRASVRRSAWVNAITGLFKKSSKKRSKKT